MASRAVLLSLACLPRAASPSYMNEHVREDAIVLHLPFPQCSSLVSHADNQYEVWKLHRIFSCAY